MNEPLQLGRYSLVAQVASGGMATVYLGRLNGDVGFGRTVAIKRLHPHLAAETEFVSMFLDEARLAARVQHPNVVPTLDVVAQGSELFLVMEYIRGESLGALLKATRDGGTTIPIPIVTAIAIGFLSGLQAAHEATDEDGHELAIVHRDVSPQNVLVGTDGVARVLDFGVAKAASRLQTTREGQLKGKLAYMAPEQIAGEVSQRTDIFSAGVVLWETLACRRLFRGETEAQLLRKVLEAEVKPPSRYNPEVTPEIDAIVLRALAKNPEDRYASAREMAADLDHVLRPASTMTVAEWVQRVGGKALAERNKIVTDLESNSSRRERPDLVNLMSGLSPFGSDDSGELPNDRSGEGVPAPPPPDVQTATTLAGPAREIRSGQKSRMWLVGALAAALAGLMILAALLFFAGSRSAQEAETAVARGPSAPEQPAMPEPAASAPPAPVASASARPPDSSPPAASPHKSNPPAPTGKPAHPATVAPVKSLDVFSGPRK